MPITNTNFYTVYQNDFKIVKLAAESGVLNEEIVGFLLSEKVSNDLKAATINALSFDIIGKNNTSILLDHLAEKYHVLRKEIISSDKLSASELLCIGYLLIMDDYFNTTDALYLLKKAQKLSSDDYTINMILALVQAQKYYAEAPCKALEFYQLFPLENSFKSPFFPEAEKIIFNYFETLKIKCTGH